MDQDGTRGRAPAETSGPPDPSLRRLLAGVRTIAVLGVKADPAEEATDETMPPREPGSDSGS